MFLKRHYNFLLVVGALSSATTSFASSCCGSSGGQSISILPPEQRYQLGLSTLYRSVAGRFDPYGDYLENEAGLADRYLITTLGFSYRFNDQWQAGMSMPFVYNSRIDQGQSRSAARLGDPALEGRYLFLEDKTFLTFRPELTFYGGLRAPIGNAIYSSDNPYDANVAGDGTYTMYGGFNAAKLYRPVKVSFDGAFFYPFSKNVSQSTLKLGNRIQLIESGSYFVTEKWSTTLGLRQLWQSEAAVDGVAASGSAARLFSTLMTVNFLHQETWSFGATYETAFPFYQYLANQPNAQTVSLAATYGGL